MAAAPVDLIQSVPLFEGLDKRELQSVASSLKERNFSAGDAIASEGQTAVGFFVIAEGEAKVTQKDKELATLKAGDYFGEIALIDEGRRTATVTAESNLRCYGMTSWEFRPLVETNASLAWKLLQAMAKQLRRSEERAG